MEFHEKLRKLRKEHAMSQEELASQLNVSRQAVSKWESGQGFPETDKLLTIGNLFGTSMDYLLKSNNDENISRDNESGYYVNRESVQGYISMKKHGARRIALGVAIIVLSISFTMLFEDALGTFLFFLGIASGVAILVLQGFQVNRYEEIEKQPLIFDEDFLREFQSKYVSMRKKYGFCIAAGIVIIIASYAVNILVEDILMLPSQYEAIYPIFWASGIAAIIINVSALTSCNVIAKNKEHINELEKDKKTSWVFGIGFLLASAIFLCIGILGDKWNPGWIVFPIAALVCTAISVYINSKE